MLSCCVQIKSWSESSKPPALIHFRPYVADSSTTVKEPQCEDVSADVTVASPCDGRYLKSLYANIVVCTGTSRLLGSDSELHIQKCLVNCTPHSIFVLKDREPWPFKLCPGSTCMWK